MKYNFTTCCTSKNIVIENTRKCNLNCEYCINGKLYKRTNSSNCDDLEFVNLKRFLDHLISIWNTDLNPSFKSIIWIGFFGGEPLLNFKLIERTIKYLKTIKLRFDTFGFNITTNGVLLDQHIDFLRENEFKILVSLDGDKNSNSYRTLKNGKNSFKKVFSNVKIIQKEFPDYFNNNVNFNTILHQKNSIENIYQFFRSEFDKIPEISELDQSNIRNSVKQEFKKIFKSYNDSFSESTNGDDISTENIFKTPKYNKLVKHLYYKSDFFYKSFEDLEFGKKKLIPTGSCIPLKRKIFFSSDCYIYPCESVGENHKMGEVSKNGFIVNYDKINSFYNDIFSKLKKYCSTCWNEGNCPVCILKTDVQIRSGKICPFWKDGKASKKELNEISDCLRDNRDLYERIATDLFLV